MTKFPSDNGHVYELKKVRMSQDKDGLAIVVRLHPEDTDSDLARAPVGAVFEGPLKYLNYVEVT